MDYHKSYVSEILEPCCGLYPGIASFTTEYDVSDYREWVSRSNGDPVPAPLMLVVKDILCAESLRSDAITREVQLQGKLFDKDRLLAGVVFSPAISTGWNNDSLYEISETIQASFSVMRVIIILTLVLLGVSIAWRHFHRR